MGLPQRFLDKVKVAPSGCWLWTGGTVKGGYGVIWDKGRMVLAHRFSWRSANGDIPENMQLDHFACSDPSCVNPEHVRPVSSRENCLRSASLQAMNAAKTQCYMGHEFTEENTYYFPDGNRRCRTCKRANDAKRRGRS